MRKLLLVGTGLSVIVILAGFVWAQVRSSIAGTVAAEALQSYQKTVMVQFHDAKIYQLSRHGIGGFIASKVSEEEIIIGEVDGEYAYVRVPARMAEKFLNAFGRMPLKLHGPLSGSDPSKRLIDSYLAPQIYEQQKQVAETPSLMFEKNLRFYTVYVMPVLLALAWFGTALGFGLARRKRRRRR